MLEDYESADIEPKLRAMLSFVETLTTAPESVGPDDIDRLRDAGLSDAAIEDAALVCSAFNMITRIADTFEFAIPKKGWAGSVKNLLGRGYA